ncbi:hypothetical protein JN11_03429 [Mucilaginibacter frigoritolerans]|uniref:Acetyltransferase (GNAT) family protein n=1 Tax=Mucilaginibacter frigoritolerans TaxID=652788 RepID=A0A562TVM3_9SPHI|nr:hypothetical protein [Mucilaginibacter frigoritolerans]TWI97607.1 hypothetical protein JN11_03429 [Mucilaginibacter frigoritolerans]
MKIRNATYHDAPDIKSLIGALGYKTTKNELISQLQSVFNHDDHEVFVCELNKMVAGFKSIHYLPQLGINKELIFISYLLVDEP